jgi:hypothetical protein
MVLSDECSEETEILLPSHKCLLRIFSQHVYNLLTWVTKKNKASYNPRMHYQYIASIVRQTDVQCFTFMDYEESGSTVKCNIYRTVFIEGFYLLLIACVICATRICAYACWYRHWQTINTAVYCSCFSFHSNEPVVCGQTFLGAHCQHICTCI